MSNPHSQEIPTRSGSKGDTVTRTLRMTHIEDHTAWPKLSRLEMPFSAAVELSVFKVRDLLTLTTGQVIETSWKESEDVLIRTADVQIGWGEFEVDEQKLLIRMTRLA